VATAALVHEGLEQRRTGLTGLTLGPPADDARHRHADTLVARVTTEQARSPRLG